MLELNHFTLSFASTGRTVLHSLNLQVRPAEIHVLIGASGAGKSLVALSVMGLQPVDAKVSGQVLLNGQLLSTKEFNAVRGRQVALIPQSVEWLDPLKTVFSQVRRAAARSGMKRADTDKAARTSLAKYGLLPESWHQYPHQLSGGMIRRVLLSVAMVSSPDFLIADEPTVGLNADAVMTTLSLMRKLANEGLGVLLISHDLGATLKVADRVSVLHDGYCVDQFVPRELVDAFEQRHEYTRSLWLALPENGLKVNMAC